MGRARRRAGVVTAAPDVYLAQRRASAPDASVWVAASAGAGKTKTLVDRVLRLMLAGAAPQRILCLTFTRAAAGEMSNRINQVLGRWAVAPDAILADEIERLGGAVADEATRAAARRLFAEVLETPGGLRIMTIHAFCESLLARFPLEAGIAPRFEVMDERTADEAMRAARDRMLTLAPSGGDAPLARALADVTAWADEAEFGELMIELAGERARLWRTVEGDPQDVDGRIGALLGVGATTTEAEVVEAACADGAFDGDDLRAAAEALAAGSPADAARGAKVAAWLADPAMRAGRFDDYRGVFLTREGQPRKTIITRKAAAARPGADGILAAEAERLRAVAGRRNAAIVAQATRALARLGRRMLQAYEAHKLAHGLLDYDDLILRVRGLLERGGAAAWVLYKLDGGIDHILIDEAQDTNPDQWAVVRALADEFFSGEGARPDDRTVFAVGDAKQSIYGFQRADPEAFARMRDYFADRAARAGRRWDSVELDRSFRSTGPVLAAVDAAFATPAAREGLGAAEIAHTLTREGQAGLVELWPPAVPLARDDPAPWTPPTRTRGADAPATRLARTIAHVVRDWLDRGEVLESRGRAAQPGDVLVLVRRRTDFVHELVGALKARNVPVAGVDRMVLREQLAIMDLVALGDFLLLPEDDLTLAAVLKGPLIGLDEEALFDLAHRRRGPLWAALQGRAGDDPRYRAAERLLSELLSGVDFAPPYELYADVLGRRGGRRAIVARLGVEANDPLDEFLALALAYERAHTPSLQGFLFWFARTRAETKREFEQAGRNEVRVMTVHGAKGLQSPIVFLADTMQTPTRGSRLLWPEREAAGGPVFLWPPRRGVEDPVCAALREEANRRTAQEYRRLLYVAMTRAEDRLYVVGHETRNKPPEDCWYETIRRGLEGVAEADEHELSAPGVVGWRGTRLRVAGRQTAPAPDKASGGAPSATPPPPLPGWARRPAPEAAARPGPLNPSRLDDGAPGARSPIGADGGDGYRRGALLHRLLQWLPEAAPARRAAAARRFLALPVHDLPPASQAELAAEAVAILEAPDFAPLFGPGSRAEVPLIGAAGGVVVSGRVDRLVVARDRVLCVDYKANRTPPAADADIPVAYLRQMAAYRAVLRKVYPAAPVSCGLLWTIGPRLAMLDDSTLDRHAP